MLNTKAAGAVDYELGNPGSPIAANLVGEMPRQSDTHAGVLITGATIERGPMCPTIQVAIAARLAGGAALCLVAWHEAEAQQAPAAGQDGPAAAAINNDEDFTRPETLFQLRYLYQAAPGNGSVPGTARTVSTDQVVLRSDLQIDLAPQWTLALRGDLPFVAKNAITPDDPTGGCACGNGDAFAPGSAH